MAECYARFVLFSRFFSPVFAYLCTLSHKNAKKEKKLSQCPAILSSRLANHAYILSFFKDSNNVVQAFSSLRAFTPVKFRFSCTKIMHTNEIDSAPKLIWKTFTTKKKKPQRTDKFDPLRDKNDLKKKDSRDKTSHSNLWNFSFHNQNLAKCIWFKTSAI